MLELSLSRHPSFPRVLVSGASISGLTIAYWLARSGFSVTVVERAPHLRPGGQALDVRGPALGVAERMGILPILREYATKLPGFSMVDAEAGRYLELMLTDRDLSAVTKGDPFYKDVQEFQQLLQQFKDTQNRIHPSSQHAKQ